jgi:hypothetical protein
MTHFQPDRFDPFLKPGRCIKILIMVLPRVLPEPGRLSRRDTAQQIVI